MKKTFLKILVVALSALLALAVFTACGGYTGTTKKDWGETDGYANGGFVRETENYVYFINGQGTNTVSNKYGDPVKGSLAVASKSEFGSSDMKAEIVVPKLFVATDYNAGVYIFGDYVYYATPSTDKKPDGSIANTSLAFMRTKLDGTDTEEYFTISGLSTEYRVVKAGEDVLIVYYDSTDKELVSYNTTTKEETIIAKTDSKAEGESLATYKFVDNSKIDSAVVVYTTTVYAEDYDEEMAESAGDNYSRKTEDYNKVYAYKAGEESAKLILNGAAAVDGGLETKYTLSFVKSGYLFFKKIDTENIGAEVTFMVAVDSFYNSTINTSNIVESASDVAETIIVESQSEVYKLSDKNIVKTTFTGSPLLVEQTVAVTEGVGKMLVKYGDYMYYTTSSNVLMRVNVVSGEKEEEQKVSDDVIQNNWYTPEVVTLNGKDYLLFCDTSTFGSSYIKAIDLGAEVKEDTDDDGNVTETYIDGSFHVAVITDTDVAIMAEAEIKKIDDALTENGNVVLEEVDGALVMPAVVKARQVYDGLTKAQKELISDETVAYLEKYEKAVEVSVKLHGLKDFDKYDDDGKTALRPVYDAAKVVIEKLEKDGDTSITSILAVNYRWYYQEADKFFNPEVED